MIARLLARFRRRAVPASSHPSVGLIRTERNTDPIAFGVQAAHEVLADDERKAARRAWADDTLQRAGIEGRAS